jgi:hypothetical protein
MIIITAGGCGNPVGGLRVEKLMIDKRLRLMVKTRLFARSQERTQVCEEPVNRLVRGEAVNIRSNF